MLPVDPEDPTALSADDHGSVSAETLPSGLVIARRYRIVTALGHGGMGEVYRADDLTLGAAVALKFLPTAVGRDPDRVRALRDEVRLARRVSHPNVCRVYDIGETEDGRPFLAMEYIDGEDLSRLLQRIGRLPKEKALDIARDICRGLAAVHEQGLVHRDLKPANVMLDGRGRARLTDFGIAVFRARERDLAGTPAYMAPEIFDGHPASVRSDVYALGLVLYEVLTGTRAIAGRTVEEIARAHRDGMAAVLHGANSNLDEELLDVLRSCLSRDPALRPASAMTVAVALSGGDTLQAALAAGETPSPSDIAVAGRTGTLRMPVGAALVALVVVLMPLAYVLSERVLLTHWRPLPQSPDVLRFKAREHLRALGVADRQGQWAEGFEADGAVGLALSSLPARQQDEFLRNAPTSPIFFWYRERAGALIPLAADAPTADDPPPSFGDVSVAVNPDGSLTAFDLRPPRASAAANAAAEPPDWRSIFRLANLDPATFDPVVPRIALPGSSDTRLAWIERAGQGPLGPRRVEAAAFRNRPVSFAVVYDRVLGDGGDLAFAPGAAMQEAASRARGLVLTAIVIAGALIAWRQVRSGRADGRGAARVGVAVAALMFASHLLARERLLATLGIDPFLRTLPQALYRAAALTMFYVAVEPFIRRHAPHQFIGWQRLLSGRFRDPLVGRDVLVGIAAGLAVLVVGLIGKAADIRAIGPSASLWIYPATNVQVGISRILLLAGQAISFTLVVTLAYAGTLSLVPRKWIAVTILFAIISIYPFLISAHWSSGAIGVVSVPIVVGVLLRFGTLATTALMTTFYLANLGLTSDTSSWQFTPTLPAALLVGIVAIGGFLTASGVWRTAAR